MNLKDLYLSLNSEPKFRIKQINKAVYSDFIDDWSKITNLPKHLREELEKKHPLKINYQLFDSKKSNTKKALIKLNDELEVESVLIKHKDNRQTVCVSSQVGCPLACTFCATGDMGFKRNLTSEEIIQQILLFARLEKPNKITNIVFMGMGEPLLNYQNTIDSIYFINNPDNFNIGARKISISTSGIIPGINSLKNEKLQINLAISLHAPNNELRTTLMPINKKYPLNKLLRTVFEYCEKTSRKVMFEYLLIDKINDGEIHAKQLATIMKHPLFFVNLIPYNPTGTYKPSKTDRIEKFKSILAHEGINFTQRYYFGGEIKAACGQLAGKQ